MATAKKNQAPIQHALNSNPSLPNLWVDSLNVAARGDNICALRFFTSLPEGVFEQVRVMTDKKKLQKFVDAICNTIDYYPTKKQPPKKGEKEPISH